MSWSVNFKNKPANDARKEVLSAFAPYAIKHYIDAGICALQLKHGENVAIDCNSYGHVCDSPNSYEVTSATIDVRKAVVLTESNSA